MQLDAIFIPAEAPVASNASRPSSPAASSFRATLASSISSSAPPNLESPIKHQSVDVQPVQAQPAQGQSVQSQSDQARSEQDQSVADKAALQSGAEFELTPDEITLVPSLECKSIVITAPGSSVTSGRTLKLSNPNSNSIKSAKAAAKPAPSSPGSRTAIDVVPAAAGTGASLAHASFPAFELLGLSAPVPNLPGPATPDPATPDPATKEQPLAGQLRSNLGGASVSATKDLDPGPAPSNVVNSKPVSRLAFSFAPITTDSISTVPTEAGSESAESPTGVGVADSNAASKAAYSAPNLSAQLSIAAAEFTGSEASLTKAPPTPSAMKASSDPALTGAPAFPSDDNQFDTPIPTAEAGIPIVPVGDIPSIASVTLQPSSPTAATPLAQFPSSLPNKPPDSHEQQPVSAAAPSQSPALSAAATINKPGMPSAAAFITIAQPPVIPVPPSAVSDKNVPPLAEPPAQMQPSFPQSRGSKVNPVPVSFSPVAPAAAEPTLTVGSAPRDSVPVQPDASDAKIAVPEASSAPETKIAIDHSPANHRPASARPANDRHTNNNLTSDVSAREANDATDDATDDATNDAISDANNVASSLNSNLSTSNLTPNPNFAAPPVALPSDANAAVVSAKASVVAQVSSTAASQPAGADKKSIPIQPNSAPNTASASGSPASSGSSSSSISSGGPPITGSSQSLPAVIAPARETSMLGTAPAPAASAPQASSDAPPLLSQAHQMLDSAPAAPMVPATPVVPGSAADLQANGQMHMGVHTDAFGAVEIHTVVQQSQIGITVHADRDMSRWFSSEVPGLESGLNNSHLNLTGVNFDHGRSGVQTATGFSNGHPANGQPRQNSSQTSGSQSAGLRGVASPETAAATESATVDIFPSDRSSGSVGNHFSFHV